MLAHFERLADTPGAIRSLRNLVFRLAVRGKLVPQDPSARLSQRDLAEARSGLESKARDAKLGRWRPSTAVSDAECGFELPRGWAWGRINDTGLYFNGRVFKPSEILGKGLPIIRIQNLTDDTKPFNYAQGEFSEAVLVHRGDILVSWSASLDAFVWQGPEGVLNQHIFKVAPNDGLVDPDFLFILLREAMRDIAVGDNLRGLTMRHIKRDPFLSHVVALPPLAEQHRIVEKADELRTLCDELEVAQREREIHKDRLVGATLHRLTRSDEADARALRRGARFCVSNLPRLTTRAADASAFRRAILELAVQGRLVKQNIDDEPAQVPLSDRALTLERSEWPHELPSGWAWSSLSRLGRSMGGGTPNKAIRSFWGGEIPWVSPKDMKVERIHDTADHITEDALAGSSARMVPAGSLLMVVRGMILAHSFPAAIAGVPVSMNQDMKALVPFLPELAPYLLLVTKGLRQSILALVRRSTHGTCRLATDELFSVPIAIPPLPEQERILARVAEVTAITDELELQLTKRQASRRALLEATLHQVLASSSS